MKRTIIKLLITFLLAAGLIGCSKKNVTDPNISESEGDIEIEIPDDQESGGY